jgi:CRP/FNR family transcriptional regulator, cyclic AMP receptor protein
MPCDAEVLRGVPLFSLLDEDEAALLASQVELKDFVPRQRIYRQGDPGGRGYIILSGRAQVTMIDQDEQEVVVNEPTQGEFFGFASMLEQTPHSSSAIAVENTECIEVDRDDILALIQHKPHAAMDMLALLGHQFHATQELVRIRANRHPNEVIEEQVTLGEHIADGVAAFGGSWKFIILFGMILASWATLNVQLGNRGWDPYPFILLNLFLSMLAAVQAPVIMMSQNRQDKKDRLRSELDYDVNRRAHSEIQGLAHKINLLSDRLEDFEESLKKDAR